MAEFVESHAVTPDWVEINSGMVRMRSTAPAAPASSAKKKAHRRSLSHLSGFEPTKFHKISVNINTRYHRRISWWFS